MSNATPTEVIPLAVLFSNQSNSRGRQKEPFLVNNKGGATRLDKVIGGKCVALYLGLAAHPQCQALTDALIEFEKAVAVRVKAENLPPLQMIYIGAERSAEHYKESMRAIPNHWFCMPFMDPRMPQIMMGLQVRRT